MVEYTAEEMRQKSYERQNQVLTEKKTAIMNTLLLAATKYGYTNCAIDEDLLDANVRYWLTNPPLNYTIRNNNIVDWSNV